MKVNKGSITNSLLLAFETAVEGVIILDSFSYSSQMRAIKGLPPHKKPAFLEAIRRLRKKGIIEQDLNSEGKIILKLTSLGKDYLGKKEEKWDGKYRIVIWDIPERKRRVRDLFRRRIKQWGFASWQRSVWISKRNVTNQLRALVEELVLENYIAVIESDDPSIGNIKLHDRVS